MTDLKCSAINCGYNEDHYCCKGDIMVGGKRAECSDDTCCESFVDETKDRFSSAIRHPSKSISIDCEAVKCVYNEDYRCSAEHVDVSGAGASDSRETSCKTFTER